MIVYDSPLQPDRNCKPFLACLPYKYISGDLLMSLSIFQMPQSCFQVAYKVSFFDVPFTTFTTYIHNFQVSSAGIIGQEIGREG